MSSLICEIRVKTYADGLWFNVGTEDCIYESFRLKEDAEAYLTFLQYTHTADDV